MKPVKTKTGGPSQNRYTASRGATIRSGVGGVANNTISSVPVDDEETCRTPNSGCTSTFSVGASLWVFRIFFAAVCTKECGSESYRGTYVFSSGDRTGANRRPSPIVSVAFGEPELIKNHIFNIVKIILTIATCVPWDMGLVFFYPSFILFLI